MPAGQAAFYTQTIEKYRGSIYTLRRGFEALRARIQRVKHQQTGDEIDLDALVRARIDALKGEEMSERILSRLERRQRDIAVVFMVDVSGSTKAGSTTPNASAWCSCVKLYRFSATVTRFTGFPG